MEDPFDKIFGDQARPLQNEAQIQGTFDDEGNPVVATDNAESVALSQRSALNRIKFSQVRVYHCGHPVQHPLGNQCGEPGCHRLSCLNCAGSCYDCSKPVCLEHSRHLETDDGKRLRLCLSCHGRVTRTRTFRGITRFLLSPFISMEEEK